MGSSKQSLLMSTLTKFYSNQINVNRMLPIIKQKTNISLRVLDWFVTNYSKKNDIVYELDNKLYFNVYLSYKAQLKAYSKKQFDPFLFYHT